MAAEALPLAEESGNIEQLSRDAADLASAVGRGGWRIDRPSFELYRDMLTKWGAPPSDSTAIARSQAASELWRLWHRRELPATGRRFVRAHDTNMLAMWVAGAAQANVWLGTAEEIESDWGRLWEPHELSVAIADTNGTPIFGVRNGDGLSLTPGDTRLPFIITAASLRPDAGDRTRRALLVTALLVAFVLMAAAAYGLYRATTRELMAARQQSDFVSAVSHEFRTPLTSMRHLTELLVSGQITSRDRTAHYYELLAHETERLHRMVESLLSFGRIDAGAHDWRLETADVKQLVDAAIDEFRREPLAKGRPLECEIEDGLPAIRADREAMLRALWNLLENAAKYSASSAPIRVSACRHPEGVLIAVGDQGVGISASEQKHIFQKFSRGADAKRAGIRGVGIGLALVKNIVEAHGGAIRLDSEVGRGSTFMLILPCRES